MNGLVSSVVDEGLATYTDERFLVVRSALMSRNYAQRRYAREPSYRNGCLLAEREELLEVAQRQYAEAQEAA